LFFNPGFLWISALLKDERENCCDDIAIDNTRDRIQFVRALISFKEHDLGKARMANAFPARKQQLLKRVTRIAHNTNKTLDPAEKVFLVVSSLLIFLLVAATADHSKMQGAQILAPKGNNRIIQDRPRLADEGEKTAVFEEEHERTMAEEIEGKMAEEQERAKAEGLEQKMAEEQERKLADEHKRKIADEQGEGLVKIVMNMDKVGRDQAPDDKKRAEMDAQQAERDRQQALRDRDQAGRDRVQADKDRVQADKDRVQAERDRMQAERNRQQAERDREQAERDREQAERDRQQSERDREQAEKDRQQALIGRRTVGS